MKTPRILATGIASLFLTLPAFAVTDTWDGNLPNAGAGDSLLSTALNWADNTAPLSDIVNTDLIFAGTTKLGPIVGATFSTNSIVFNNTAGAFVISGATLNVGAGGITNNDANTQTITNVLNFGLVTSATINAASGPLTFTNLVTGPTTLTVDGAFATTFTNLSSGGTILKQGAGTMSWLSSAATDADVTVSAGTMTLLGATTFNTGSAIAVNGTGTFNINQGAILDGAQLTRVSGATLAIAAGEALTVQNGGDAILTGSFSNTTASTIVVTGAGSTFSTTSTLSIVGGSTLNVSAGGDVSSGAGSIQIGTGGNGTGTVDGSGSSLGGGSLSVALNGSTGLLTFSNGSTGAFGTINVDSSGTVGTSGTLNIQSSATVSGTGLTLANGAAATTGAITITGAGSVLTLTAAANATIGAASASAATFNVQSGGTFNSGTGTTTVNATGTVVIGGSVSTFNANGNMVVNGLLTRASGGFFNLAAGRTLTIQNGGDALVGSDDLDFNGGNVTVNGTGSTLNGPGAIISIRGGSTVTVLAGGSFSTGNSVHLGNGSAATFTVDGTGSSLSAGVSRWGENGGTANVTFLNGGTSALGGVTIGDLTAGSVGTVQVLSGADVTNGSLTIGSGSADGTLTIDGIGSTWVQTGSFAAAIGGAAVGSGKITVQNGGTFTTSTGTTTVNATGTVEIPDGTFNANGNLTVNGGNFSAGLNSDFNLAASRTLTVSTGGTASFANNLDLTTANSRLTVTTTGSTVTGSILLARNSNTISVSGGADVSFTQLFLGTGPSMSTTVSGSGSTLTATTATTIGNGTVSYSSGASGALGALDLDADLFGVVSATGTLLIQSGATVTAGATNIATTGLGSAANASVLTVTGAGSAYTQSGSSQLSVGSSAGGGGISTGTINVVDGGTYTSGTGLVLLNATGTFNIDGGTLDLKGALQRNGGALNFNTGTLKMIDNLTIGTGGLLGTALTLDNTRRYATTGTTTIDAFRTLTLNGGEFRTGALVNNGNIVFNSGTLGITGAGGFNIGTGALGANVTLGTGAHLQVSQTTTIASGALLRLAGGAFTGLFVVNNGTVDFQDGTLDIQSSLNNTAGSRLFVGGLSFNGGSITNAGRITLQNGLGEISGAGSIQNTGIVTGDGTIGKAFTNSASGQLRAEAGKTLYFTGTIATNAGTFSLEGGTLEFTNAVTNGASGTITGFGALRSALLTNQGNIGLSGDARFYGDVTNASGGKIITSGGSTTTFYDDVIHNGTEIRTSAGGASVFFGAVSGAGPFTGTGTVYFEGDLRPGNSPTLVNFGGDVVYGMFAQIEMELGGTIRGTQYDAMNVGGNLAFDGTMNVSLYNGFQPQFGDVFDLFNWGSTSGNFDTVIFPALNPGLLWDSVNLYTDGSIRVVPEPGVATLLLATLGLLGFRRRR